MTPAEVAEVRERYRPGRIVTLFVAESPPVSGKFFYCGDTAMARYMQRAVEEATVSTDDFLKSFKARGWFLDDLALEPIDHLKGAPRRAACRAAQRSLADRIAVYEPLAIVTLLASIRPFVLAAATAAGSTAPIYHLPFPGQGHQRRFLEEMARIRPKLPTKGQIVP